MTGMTGNEIFGPFLAMLLLTAIVWLVMYWRRLNYIFRHRIDAQQLTIPEKGAALLPEQVNWPALQLQELVRATGIVPRAMSVFVRQPER